MEEWRPFYNYLSGRLTNDYSDGGDPWELLEQRQFERFWDALYHAMEADLPALTAGRLSLIPPPLRKYFESFLAESEETTWSDQLLWRAGLSPEDRYLWDSIFDYHVIAYYSPDYREVEPTEKTAIPGPLRQQMRDADRQWLVDFVNTLEDLTCSVGCVELWRSSFDFWRWHVTQGLTRALFYLNELSPDIGIELEQPNLDAVRDVLRPMVVGLYCGSLGVNDMREIIAAAEGVSELQRAALYQMVEVRQQEILESGDPNSPSGICAPTAAPPEPPPTVDPADVEPGAFSLEAVPQSPTEMVALWSYGPERVTRLFLYRDGERLGEFPAAQTSYVDEGLNPNERYKYRVVFWLGDGSWRAAETTVATLAHAPRIYGPMEVTGESFRLAIVSDQNPPETEYRITLSDRVGVVTSEESASKCRTFDGLLPGASYRFEAVAVNLDGVETSPVGWLGAVEQEDASTTTQRWDSPDDAWVVDRLNAVSSLYELTEDARVWMLSDLGVEFLRDLPAYSAYRGDHITIGPVSRPTALMGEMMQGFWQHWDGFMEDCGAMNPFTFRQAVARFMLEFKEADDTKRESEWEEWRPFYSFLEGLIVQGYSGDSDPWELLALEEFKELGDPLFRKLWRDIPSTVAGKLALIPPPLQPYFENFLADTTETTWHEELTWFAGLSPEDTYLWNSAFYYYDIVHYSWESYDIEDAEKTTIIEETRRSLRDVNRQLLVDFVNTLEELSCSYGCNELWDSFPDFWDWYVRRNLFRAQFYLEELSPEIGIELDQPNLDAVRDVLRPIVFDLYCGRLRTYDLRDVVAHAEGISRLQRAALREIVEVRHRELTETGNPTSRSGICVDWRP